jgi:hypothetical protein
LGDAASLELEFAKVNTHGRLAGHVRWMVAGVLLYLLVTPFSSTVASIFVWLGLSHGLGSVSLAVLGGFVRITVATGAVLLVFGLYSQFLQPHTTQPISMRATVLGALVLVLCFVGSYALQMLCTTLAARTIRPQDFGVIALSGAYADMAWRLLMPMLLIGWLAARHFRGGPKPSVRQ